MNARRLDTLSQTLWTYFLGLVIALLLSAPAMAAPSSGAIWTTLGTGATVNANVYDNKADVYLNGGPKSAGGDGLADGQYYFQVTDPASKVLLSTDSILCRQVTVSGGRIAGASGICPHANGATLANGNKPVQVIPYDDTPNSGGEYKVWLTKVENYNLATCANFGFCDNEVTKTDNFKVRNAGPAFIVACKFNDMNGNGVQDSGDTTISNWPISATGVDGGPVSAQTDSTGCVSFTVSTFPANVTITEGFLGLDWVQTAPADGARARSGISPAYTVTGGVVTTTDIKGGDLLDIDFGNHNPDCSVAGQCEPPPCILRGECGEFPGLTVTKDAFPTYKVTWGIEKSVDTARIDTSTSGVANYTVTVTHDGGTGFVVNGTIKVSNPTIADAVGVNVTDAVDNGGTCVVTGGTNVLVKAGELVELPYTCTYSSLPAAGTNTATATWAGGLASGNGTAAVDFASAVVVDGTVNVTDTMGGALGTLSYTDPSPSTFTYPITLTGTPGTCVDKPNTATFASTTSNSQASGSATATVKVCTGLDPTVTKTATPSFKRAYTWTLAKAVDKTSVNISGGTATFNYTVTATQTGVSDSDWQVTGSITVSNPNDWEDITVSVADAIPNGGSCTIEGGASLLVPKSGSASKNYTCTYASAPTASAFVNTATVTWNSATYATPTGSASGTAPGAFTTPTSTVDKTITVKDVFNGGAADTLGTATGSESAPFTTKAFTYSHSVGSPAGTCTNYPNTATFTSADSSATGSASASVQVCAGANLVVRKTAAPAFVRTYLWNIAKSVDQNLLILGGTANYSVTANQTGVSDGGWTVTGTISVSNPNTWQSVTFNLGDAIDNGGTCTITGGGTGIVVAAGGSVTKSYSCTYSGNPSSGSFTNTATATWDAAAYSTPGGSASGTAGGAFSLPTSTVNQTITVTDTMGSTTTTLGTLTANDSTPFASQTFTYARTIAPPVEGCSVVNNTARIAETNQSASAAVTTCGIGHHTMGFWQNKNGQKVIDGADPAVLGAWLRQFNPFSDAPSANIGAYVTKIIKAANCNGPTCNTMLRGQMVATALTVYFSDAGLGGNVLELPIPLGSAIISLTNPEDVRAAFGGAGSMSVLNMLLYQNVSDPAADAGANWYGQVKTLQVLAKDAFDNINNGQVVAP